MRKGVIPSTSSRRYHWPGRGRGRSAILAASCPASFDSSLPIELGFGKPDTIAWGNVVEGKLLLEHYPAFGGL